jgi:hypothetical protein
MGHPFNRHWLRHDVPRLNEELVGHARQQHTRAPFDLIFCMVYDFFIQRGTLQELRTLGVPICNYHVDMLLEWYLVAKTVDLYDFMVCAQRENMAPLRARGGNPVYMQMAANPRYYYPRPGTTLTYDVTFVGTRQNIRPSVISYLYQNGIDVQVFGKGWQPDSNEGKRGGRKPLWSYETYCQIISRLPHKLRNEGWKAVWGSFKVNHLKSEKHLDQEVFNQIGHPPLPFEDMVRLYGETHVNLGFLNHGYAYLSGRPIRQIRLREFEVPMSGGLYCTEYKEELGEFYELEKEIITYNDKEELLDKVRYYLAHPEAAARLRRAGYERARRDHTWARRFTHLFEEIGLKVVKQGP